MQQTRTEVEMKDIVTPADGEKCPYPLAPSAILRTGAPAKLAIGAIPIRGASISKRLRSMTQCALGPRQVDRMAPDDIRQV